MSGIPFKGFAAVAATSAYLLVGYKPDLLLFSRPSYLGTFFQLFFLQLFAFSLWRIILYPKFFSPIRHIPSPSGSSWWNGQYKRISKEATGMPMRDWIASVPNDGLIRYHGLLNGERLLVTTPNALREVLVTRNYDFAKPSHLAAGLGRLLGIGILIAEGDEHKLQRKNLAPAFAFRHIKDLYPVFWDKSRENVVAMTKEIRAEALKNTTSQDVEKEAKPVVTEVGDWASRATLDIIGIAALGCDFGAIANPNTELNSTYRTVFKPSGQAQILGLLGLVLPEWFVKRIPLKRNGEIEAAAAFIRKTCRQQIRAKKEKLEKNELKDVDILSVAMESGGFSEENMVDQMMTFLAAGHETTATSMIWAIYMLCLYPDVQTRLRREIREKLPSLEDSAKVTSQEIDYMPYLNAVCSEVLRYYPPVPLTLREAVKDTVIAGQRVPAGTRVMLVPWAINRHKALWGENADSFDPDRWMPSASNPASANGGAASNYSFMTFLHGPRSCIGQKFAQAEFACLLAAWVGRFEFELDDKELMDEKNIVIKGGITAKPTKGLYVRTKVVEGW